MKEELFERDFITPYWEDGNISIVVEGDWKEEEEERREDEGGEPITMSTVEEEGGRVGRVLVKPCQRRDWFRRWRRRDGGAGGMRL